MRYFAMLLVGLFIGSLGAVAGLSALRQGTPYNDALMSMMRHQVVALQAAHENNQCTPEEISRRFSLMAAAASEIDAAFLPVGDDARFRELSGNLRDALVQVQAGPITTCPALKQAMGDVGQHCKGCHDVFR